MKIVLLCGTSLDSFQQKVLKPIVEDPAIAIVAALVDCRPRPSFKQRFLKNLRRGRGGYMIIMLFRSCFAKNKPTIGTRALLSSYGIPCIDAKDPYSGEVVQKIEGLNPDAMVMLGGFGIVKEPLLKLAPQGILSYHHGDMRKYRGQPVGFWELYHNEKEMGVTVQKLAAGIDRGIPIVEKVIPIKKGDTVATLRNRALDNSVAMMHEALALVQKSDFHPAYINNYGKIYTIPNLRQYLILQFKLMFRK